MNNKPVLVVEGVSDMNRLNNIIEADFVICNGSAISKETIMYISKLVKTREVIVLTDPDYPGLQIRNKISSAVPQVKHAFVSREKSSNGKKLGVAECQKDEIIKALSNAVSFVSYEEGNLKMEDLVLMFLVGNNNSSYLRKKVADYYGVGYVNAKTLLKRLNMLGITKEELEGVINDLQ